MNILILKKKIDKLAEVWDLKKFTDVSNIKLSLEGIILTLMQLLLTCGCK